jgi:hypothetical protein
VTLPPGRLRPATRPACTGSVPATNTIGIVAVAVLAASAAATPPGVATTLTRRPINSAASSGNRASSPCPQRYSMTRLRPSTWPVSTSPLRKPATYFAFASGEPEWRKPISGIVDGCARAASGQSKDDDAPPSSDMTARRLMCAPLCPRVAPYHTTAGNAALCITAFLPARLPQRVRLGPDLNSMSGLPPQADFRASSPEVPEVPKPDLDSS